MNTRKPLGPVGKEKTDDKTQKAWEWWLTYLSFNKYSDTSANEDNSFRNHIR